MELYFLFWIQYFKRPGREVSMISEKYKKQHETTINELTRLLHEKKYAEITNIIEIDQGSVKEIEDYFEEYLEDMGYDTIDVYGTPCMQKCEQEVVYVKDGTQDFVVDYYLTADGDLLGLCLNLKYREVNDKLICSLDFDVCDPEEDEYYLYGMDVLRGILNALHGKEYQRIEQCVHKSNHGKGNELGAFLDKYFQKVLSETGLENIDDYSVFNDRDEDINPGESFCALEYQLTADGGKDLGVWIVLEIEGKNKKISLNFENEDD